MAAELLPNDASIEQVAEAFGIAGRVNELTPMARRLTKGQLVGMLGASDSTSAARMVSAGALPAVDTIVNLASDLLGGLLGGRLGVNDVQSIEQVFGGAFPAEEKAAMLTHIAATLRSDEETLALEEFNFNCCCCPCCCATAVLEPASQTVA